MFSAPLPWAGSQGWLLRLALPGLGQEWGKAQQGCGFVCIHGAGLQGQKLNSLSCLMLREGKVPTLFFILAAT